MLKNTGFFVLLFVLFSTTFVCRGQGVEQEMGLEFLGKTVSPGYSYYSEKFVLEGRYNYDAPRTGTISLGKSFGDEKFSIVPAACVLFGLYNGVGPKLSVFSETQKLSVNAYVQYAKMNKDSSFAYGWFQAEGKLGRWVQLGLGSQAFKEKEGRLELDIGPSVTLRLRRLSLSFVPFFRTTKEERGEITPYLGVFYAF